MGADGVMAGTESVVIPSAVKEGGTRTEDAGREGAKVVTGISQMKGPTSLAAAHANASR